jgi:protein subunit release factor A
MLDKLRIVKQRFDEVSDLIIQPDIITDQKRYVKLNKEYKDLTDLIKDIFDTLSKSEWKSLWDFLLSERIALEFEAESAVNNLLLELGIPRISNN